MIGIILYSAGILAAFLVGFIVCQLLAFKEIGDDLKAAKRLHDDAQRSLKEVCALLMSAYNANDHARENLRRTEEYAANVILPSTF
jgi:hypothetical protein